MVVCERKARPPEPRRSSRLQTQDSNGRDYLASLMPGWDREKLEAWITSSTVRPHLQLWAELCIHNPRRFNQAIDWINSGDKGYYYDESDLEEDLLLACLAEGAPEVHGKKDSVTGATTPEPSKEDGKIAGSYGDPCVKTGKWITQELWARTAWRIVYANTDPGQAFAGKIVEHPAACYGFVIELLTTAFHSIAHRGKESCYHRLICGYGTIDSATKQELQMEAKNDEHSEDDLSVTSLISSSTETSDHSSDLDYCQKRSHPTLLTSKTLDITKQSSDSNHDDIGMALVREWIAGVQAEDQEGSGELRMVSEDGEIIRGYRRAPESSDSVIGRA